jgi:hypothetical protein
MFENRVILEVCILSPGRAGSVRRLLEEGKRKEKILQLRMNCQ